MRLTGLDAPEGAREGLAAGGGLRDEDTRPPSRLSRFFRNALYAVGFQGPFQLQVNPAALRAAALWQKFIRRAAGLRLGAESAVADVYATFVDPDLGSCGELGEWVDGRTWRFEVNDRLDRLRAWSRGEAVEPDEAGSPEYRAKRSFMSRLVALLHELGAHELARQYEWWTCKSQPNVLKRRAAEDDPAGGLTAVDFRPGLALLPFLPMSPADFRLILEGVARGSLVQFDRGDLAKLEAFVDAHREHFGPLAEALGELREAEEAYRSALPDVMHHHLRLLWSPRLWRGMLEGAAAAAETRGRADPSFAEKLRRSRVRAWLFTLVGFIPFLGRRLQRLWGRADVRAHLAAVFTQRGYLGRAFTGRAAEALAAWIQRERVGPRTVERLLGRLRRVAQCQESGRSALLPALTAWPLFLAHGALAWLPRWLHRLLADPDWRRAKLVYVFVRPVRLYFHAAYREQWLREMVADGQRRHLLTDEDAAAILGQLGEPFVQKYLRALAVHVCTFPITRVVAFAVAIGYVATHPELSWQAAWDVAWGILLLFHTTPISPGSLVRGLYVLCLVIRERNVRDYKLALPLAFFRFTGYLAFPVQMAYRYPALARFMASHWATGAVHALPVFGERGALLEHGMFSLFYNYPLTVRRRLRERAAAEAGLRPRYWPTAACAAAAAGVLVLIEAAWLGALGRPTHAAGIWWAALWPPLLAGYATARAARGARSGGRIAAGAVTGILIGPLHIVGRLALKRLFLGNLPLWERTARRALILAPREMFFFGLIAAFGAILAELFAHTPKPPPRR